MIFSLNQTYINTNRLSTSGLLLRLPCLDNVYGDDMFDDRQFFEVEAQGFPSNAVFIEDANETDNDTKM